MTYIVAKLKLYQWFSILALIIGILFSSLPFENHKLDFSLNINCFITATVISLATAFSYGMDFPESKRPFSRLSGN